METAAPTPVVRLHIEADCEPTVNFATQQYDVPIVKQIRITNAGGVALEGVRIRVAGEPEFFPACETLIAAIPAGAKHTLEMENILDE